MNRDVLSGEADTPVIEVVSRMREDRQSAFIVCEKGFPIGVITERDTIDILDEVLSGASYQQLSAKSIMASPVHTLPETAGMNEVVRIMTKFGFRRVPITNERNQLSGIVNLIELQSAMNAALEKRGQDLEKAVMTRTAELQEANAKLEQLSIRDGLTGLLNRRAMGQKLDDLQAVARRYGNCYSVILCDIDHFKILNDTEGHLHGDSVLRSIADALGQSIRLSDSLYRYGGEEFLIALPETNSEGARGVAERIRSEIEALAIPHPSSPTADIVTISAGFAEVFPNPPPQTQDWHTTVDHADQALYRAKQGGRNRITGWAPSI